jgi:hypothetical protein
VLLFVAQAILRVPKRPSRETSTGKNAGARLASCSQTAEKHSSEKAETHGRHAASHALCHFLRTLLETYFSSIS